MGTSHGSPRSDLQITTPSDNTIVLTRTFNAPRRMVWEAMTSPDKMKRWMLPPPGWTLSVCDCDARVAGALRLVWKNEQGDQSLTLNGVFSEVARHERMVHTELMLMGADQVIGSQVETHEFVDNGSAATTMRITQVYVSKEARDGALGSGMEVGMEAGYLELDALLAKG